MIPTHSANNSPSFIEALNNSESSSSHTLTNITLNSRLNPRQRNMFHLRRHMKDVRYTRDMEIRMYNLFKQYSPYPSKSLPENDPAYLIARETLIYRATTILLDKVTRFGRNPEVVDVVLHSDQQGQMVSRLHAEINAEPDPEDPTKFLRYSIADRSLNGTYVNDRRAPTVSGELYLKKGDVIKFGHVNGASYKPGEYAIGNESEFIFTFEPAYDGMDYIGHTPDGNRIERKGPQAYIHLGAHSLLPHEFDLFSLVPKREADLSVIPYGSRINAEQKRVEYIQPHSQLVTKNDPKHSDPSTVHPGTFGSASIPIPGVSNPAIIPNMTNFNLLTDLVRLQSELQPQSGITNNESVYNFINQYVKSSTAAATTPMLSPEVIYLLQYLQQQQTQPNLNYFSQPTASTNAIHNINLALNANLLRSYIQPNANDSVITALRQIATPYLNGHTALNTINGINSGSGANIMQALYAALTPSLGGVHSAATLAAAAAAVATTSSANVSAAGTPHSFMTANDVTRQMFDDKRKQQIVESSPDGVASASSTTSEETTATTSCRNPAADLLYHDSATTTPQRYSTQLSDVKPEKVAINEKTVADIAKAAAAAAVGAHYRNSAENNERKTDSTTTTFETSISTPAIASVKTLKQQSKMLITDHIQETIDFVAKHVTEKPSDEDMIAHHVVEHTPKPRKRKKRTSENENGKHKENVLKILDDAVAKMEPEKPKPIFKIEMHDPEPSTIDELVDPIDREQSSSGGSLIMCEANPDDPGLVNGSNIDLLAPSKLDELKPMNRGLDNSKGRKKKSMETTDSESDMDDDDNDDITSKYNQTRKHQHSNSSAASDGRPRKKSTSVKSRVIRVLRSPIPSYKKGPERLPGHKSNEVARLLYDLEGSYMHVARKGDGKRQRNNTDKKHDSDEDSENEEETNSRPSSSNKLPAKRKSIDRSSNSPAKKSKDSLELENNIENSDVAESSGGEEEDEAPPTPLASPKINGNETRKGKRSKDSEIKPTPKPRKNAKKVVVEVVENEDNNSDRSNSDSEEEEPTPKRRRGGRTKKETTTIKPPKVERKKPGRQPNKPKKKPGRKAKDKNTFVELTNNEWERCAYHSCKHPRVETTVNWVQCDDCDSWYHILCLFGRDDKSVIEDQFHCGCHKEATSVLPTAVMA